MPWTQKLCNFVNISESVGSSDLCPWYNPFSSDVDELSFSDKIIESLLFLRLMLQNTVVYTIHAARQYMVLLLYRYSMYNLGTMQKQGNLGWFWLMSDCHWHIPCNQNTTVVPA